MYFYSIKQRLWRFPLRVTHKCLLCIMFFFYIFFCIFCIFYLDYKSGIGDRIWFSTQDWGAIRSQCFSFNSSSYLDIFRIYCRDVNRKWLFFWGGGYRKVCIVMENVMERSWKFVLDKLYEPLYTLSLFALKNSTMYILNQLQSCGMDVLYLLVDDWTSRSMCINLRIVHNDIFIIDSK